MRRAPFFSLVGLTAAVLAAPPLRAGSPPQQPRIVAVGDVHGAAANFAAILQKAGLIDGQSRWSGGKDVLVQTGDMSDRGAGMREALDLLMALEGQAAAAGGRVHAVLGNHEVMNLVGETRDVTPEIFATFGGEEAMRSAFGPAGTYGKWLRSKPVIAEVGGSIFLHGGIDLEFSKASLSDVNRRARRELTEWDEGVRWLVERKLVSANPRFLDAVEAARAEVTRLSGPSLRDRPETRDAAAVLLPLVNIGSSSLFNPGGPLWFRGYSTWTDEEGDARIEAILKTLRGKRLVTGHTVQPGGRITERFGGRLFLIDTGMLGGRFFPSGRPSALEITGDTVKQLYLDDAVSGAGR